MIYKKPETLFPSIDFFPDLTQLINYKFSYKEKIK